MAIKDTYPVNSSENSRQPHPTTTFFNALSDISARPGATDLFWYVNELASRPKTAEVFGPLQTFNSILDQHDYETAVESVNLSQPEGVPIDVICGYENGGIGVHHGKIVALLEPSADEHGAFTGLAVSDFGEGPVACEVNLRANVPGTADFKSMLK